MVLPAILFLVVFSYIPMVGVVMSFVDYNPVVGFAQSEWVGLKYFKELFTDQAFPMIMKTPWG